MFERIREQFINIITSRLTILVLIALGLGGVLVYRIFDLQIVNGQTYLENFLLQSKKTRTIDSTRGCIYDRNGNLLAYNELAYSVKIEDVFEKNNKNENLNDTIYRLIKMIEKNGDKVVTDFNIVLDENGEFAFSVSDTRLLRFLADVYGHSYIDDLKYEEKTATAQEVIEYLCSKKKFAIGQSVVSEDGSKTFVIGKGYTKAEVLQIVTIRYAMSLTSYQKYIGTTVASDVSEKTVAAIMENINELEGVSIEEATARRYVDGIYFSQIIGYTGKISSSEELEALNTDESGKETGDYTMNDVVGRSGIEAYMEKELQGTKGYENVYVDSLGKVISVTDREEAVAGNDVYLTIDKDLQIAAYNILEQNIAGILLEKIENIKEYKPKPNDTSSDIKIPIYDVYFALFNNGVIDLEHMQSPQAAETERFVHQKFLEYKDSVYEKLREELMQKKTPYDKLNNEYQVYESNIVIFLEDNGILMEEKYNSEDEILKAWKTDETISLNEFLNYAITQGWIDVTKLDLPGQYADSEEIYKEVVDYIFEVIENNVEFQKRFYKYMLRADVITGRQVCYVLCEQNLVEIESETDVEMLYDGRMSPYQFMINRISNLEVTPAQLALDPYSGSVVITDVNTGEVLALVSYPSYDNNRMANSVDAEYFAKLTTDKSSPMINYATQYRSAPGSTFKMVTATAALNEGIIHVNSKVQCVGIYEKITPSPRCWVYPRGHGMQNVSEAIQHSCNYFFYDIGYRMSTLDGSYDAQAGLDILAKYADLYGLSEKSGVEIDEWAPKVSDEFPVPSAIGQGTNNYTSVGLAKYVATVANSGTCYDLTLLDKVTDFEGNVVKDYEPVVRNKVELSEVGWRAIHEGMRAVVQNKQYFNNVAVAVAGKTGTAQETTSRAPHALFVGYAPYENPEIAIVTRIAYGYASDYAAQTTKDVVSYYYGLVEEDDLITGNAKLPDAGVSTREY